MYKKKNNVLTVVPDTIRKDGKSGYASGALGVDMFRHKMKQKRSDKHKKFLLEEVDELEAQLNDSVPPITWKIPTNDLAWRTQYLHPRAIFEGGLRYFRKCIKEDETLSLSGLSRYLGYSRENFLKMTKKDIKPELYFTIVFRDFLEEVIEKGMVDATNPAANIFRLKNLGWVDKIDIQTHMPTALTDEERRLSQSRIQGFSEEETPLLGR